MSWRILFQSAYFDNWPDELADWVIAGDASDEDMVKLANDVSFGHRPLHIFVPDEMDSRYLRLKAAFEDLGMEEANDWSLWVKRPN